MRRKFANLRAQAKANSMGSQRVWAHVIPIGIWISVSCGLLLTSAAVLAQPSVPTQGSIAITGMVVDATGRPVDSAEVRLESDDSACVAETKSGANGRFELGALHAGKYKLTAKKQGFRSREIPLMLPLVASADPPKIVLEADETGIEFSDKPSFAVAGVTDFTAVGGHGADTILRTSEDLTRETYKLNGPDANGAAGDAAADRERVKQQLAQGESAELRRTLGELDEKLGDPLAAVKEFERAAKLDGSEQSYFEWGSELLLHRAIWQARDVFETGSKAYPKSARMFTGLGAAMFAGAQYDDAANALCRAADLNPTNLETYRTLGQIEVAAPSALACVEAKLEGFVAAHPDNSLANYFYAMAVLKKQEKSPDAGARMTAKGYFEKAVVLDAKCADAYLQLGNLAAGDHDTRAAIELYQKAIEANPELGDAHYRLGVAYDRIGESAKAKSEFALHDQIAREQAAEIDQQRKEIKQFVIAPADAASAPKN
jgi:tetratricopeptide (TPR) repeat protein